MSAAADLLTDAFETIHDGVVAVVDELSADELAQRPAPEANTVAWLSWHLLRVQDSHVADAAGSEQVWLADGWHARFDLPLDAAATGYGQSEDEVGSVRFAPGLLVEYADAVTARTLSYVGRLGDDDLDRVVDDSWDPPVTLGVRLMSVIGDDLKHLGQAEYVRGLL